MRGWGGGGVGDGVGRMLEDFIDRYRVITSHVNLKSFSALFESLKIFIKRYKNTITGIYN